jgi:hypothetical protein
MMSDESGRKCELPKWVTTKRGRRCGQICLDARGRRRFRFVKGAACVGTTSPEDVTEFSDPVGALAEALGVEPVRLEPMPLALQGLEQGIGQSGIVDSKGIGNRSRDGKLGK